MGLQRDVATIVVGGIPPRVPPLHDQQRISQCHAVARKLVGPQGQVVLDLRRWAVGLGRGMSGE